MAATATGIHHRSYTSELALRATRAEYVRLGLMLLLLVVLPFVLDNYWLSITNVILIAVIGAVGLNILVGYTGQISLGQGGFLAVGAYSSAILAASRNASVKRVVAGAPLSRSVGMAGSERVSPVVARARMRPDLICSENSE